MNRDCSAIAEVRFAPNSDRRADIRDRQLRANPEISQPLLDYLVDERKYAGWNVEAERFGGLEVDDQLELGRLHHWHLGRVCSF